MALSLGPQTQNAGLASASPTPSLAPDSGGASADKDTKDRVEKFEKESAALVDEQKKIGEETRRRNDQLESSLSLAKPPEYKPQQYVQPKQTSLQEQWGSLAMMAAMLGSMFTRNHLTTALNAGAAVMQGFQKKDQAAVETAYKQWQTANENYSRAFQYQQEAYNQAVQSVIRREQANTQAASVDNRAAQSRLTALATAFKDENMLELGRQRGLQAQINELDRRQKEHDQLEIHGADLEKEKTARDEVTRLKEEWTAHPESAPTASEQFAQVMDILERGGSHAKGQAQQLKLQFAPQVAKAIENGSQPPVLTGLYGMSGPVRAQLQKDGFDLSKATMEWDAAKRQVTNLNGPQMTRFVGLANSVSNTIDEVRRISQQMNLGNFPLLNRAELETIAQTQANTPKGQLARRYIVATNTLKEEFAGLANGGYAPTESVWHLANSQLSENFGVKEMDSALGEIQRLIKYRVSNIPGLSRVGPGTQNRYTGATGKPEGEEGGQPSRAASQSAEKTPVHVSTPEEARKLPSGTHIILPDGSPGVVP